MTFRSTSLTGRRAAPTDDPSCRRRVVGSCESRAETSPQTGAADARRPSLQCGRRFEAGLGPGSRRRQERGRKRLSERRDGHEADAVGAALPSLAGVGPGHAPRGHDRALEAEASRFAQPALDAGDRAQLAEQADLAESDGPGRTGRSRSEDASAIANGRSSAGSSTRSPPARLA